MLLRTVACLLALGCVGHALAQSGAYPAKPIRVLVPYAPGGGADVMSRPVFQKLSEVLGQQLLADNRGSAGGIIAVELAAKAAPDGYTLLLGSGSTQAINPSLFTNLPYESPKDFAPITLFVNAPLVLVANSKFPARTIMDVIAYGKANPGKINFGSAGSSIGLLSIELLQLMSGIKVQHIPYNGSGPAFTGVLAGDVDMFLVNIGVVASALKDGRVRAIGNGGLQRLQAIPDVPTIDESGLKGYESGSWYGLMAPAGTPRAIIDRLNAESVKILKSPEMTNRFNIEGAYAVANTPEQFSELIRREIAMWAKVVKSAGIQPQPL